MEWMTDPSIWVGLATLVALEIVLGIDNLIFIAILAGRLPETVRQRARLIGLSGALVMRLASAGEHQVGHVADDAACSRCGDHGVSWRDLILIGGGLFLLVKATTEIHERLEVQWPGQQPDASGAAAFWPVVAQIVVLDLVFSLDSVITAVGMVDELYVMMAAVVIAVAVMFVAAKPLSAFITARPSLIILCLGFLLMVGLVLVVDGLGVHVPKGYVYSAIGFSVLIEMFNQIAMRNRRKAAPLDAAAPARGAGRRPAHWRRAAARLARARGRRCGCRSRVAGKRCVRAARAAHGAWRSRAFATAGHGDHDPPRRCRMDRCPSRDTMPFSRSCAPAPTAAFRSGAARSTS